MAVSTTHRPESAHLAVTEYAATFSNFAGLVAVNRTAHLLLSGSIIYIKSTIENYNGLWYVTASNVNYFIIRRGFNSEYQDYITETETKTCIYQAGSIPGIPWSCVHLPIIYKISNNLWPTNSADTIRDITGVTDSNGYCNITVAGDIKATGSAAALEYIKITGCTNTDYNGVWQIITYSSDTSFIIDLPYSASADTDLTNNGSVQYYYNNYTVKVQVWGGLGSGHTFTDQKPSVLLATLDLIPDEDNICMFSISEILKSQIKINNNLLLGTLPNNIDAFTKFYIKYAEVYDDSDGTTLSTLTASYTDDLGGFEGFAVNAVLPFKNVYAGALSEYASGKSTQKFLTLFDIPVLFSGQYFDFSFIAPNSDALFLRREYYSTESLLSTSDTAISEFNEGVYRLQIGSSDVCESVEVLILDSAALSYSGWQNQAGSDRPWHFPNYTLHGKNLTSATITPEIPSGTTVNITLSGVSGDSDIIVVLKQSAGGATQQVNFGVATGTNQTYTENVTTTDDFDIIELRLSKQNPTLDIEISLVSISDVNTISITNNTFTGAIAPWTNVDNGGTAWSYSANSVTATLSSFPNDVTDYLKNALGGTIASGEVFNLQLTVNVPVGISGSFSCIFYDGTNYSFNYSSPVVFGSALDQTINISGTMGGLPFTSATDIQIFASKLSGVSGAVFIRDVTLTKGTEFSIPNASFSTTGSWTQSGNNYPWIIAGNGVAYLNYNNNQFFEVDFFSNEVSRVASKTIYIAAGVSSAYNISFAAATGEANPLEVEYAILLKSSGVTIHTITGSTTTVDIVNITGTFTPSQPIDQITFLAENVGTAQVVTFTVLNIEIVASIQIDRIDVTIVNEDDDAVSETKTLEIGCNCLSSQATGYYLTWLNYLGGFDYWYFTSYADNIIDITDSGETETNIFTEWPNSYGEFSDTIRKQTFRDSRQQILIRSQHVTLEQINAIKYIKTSPLVQIVNSIYDRRTVIVDTDSFTVYKEENKLYEISFTITYTDDVPSQRV